MASEADRASPGLQDIGALGAWTRGLLVAQALACLLAVAVAFMFGTAIDDENRSLPWLAISLVKIALFIVTAVTFLIWTHRATANAHRLGAPGLGFTPGWAVGWYFVPIACLGMPMAALRETWKASINPRDWEIVRLSPILDWWWAFWLLSCIADTLGWRIGSIDEEAMQPVPSYVAEMLGIVADLLFVPASLLLCVIVGRVTAVQSRRLATDVESARLVTAPAGSPRT